MPTKLAIELNTPNTLPHISTTLANDLTLTRNSVILRNHLRKAVHDITDKEEEEQ